MMASLPIPQLEDLTRERELVAEMLRRSRLTLLYGEAVAESRRCSGASVHRKARTSRCCSTLGTGRCFHACGIGCTRPCALAWVERPWDRRPNRPCSPRTCVVWRARLGVRFIVVFDQFEHYLIQSPTDEGVASFAEEFIRAANSPVGRGEFSALTSRGGQVSAGPFPAEHSGLYDSWIRLPPRRERRVLTGKLKTPSASGPSRRAFPNSASGFEGRIQPAADAGERFGSSTAGSRSSTGRRGSREANEVAQAPPSVAPIPSSVAAISSTVPEPPDIAEIPPSRRGSSKTKTPPRRSTSRRSATD